MGSYGIGVSRLVGAIIEAKYNNEIMKWPKTIAFWYSNYTKYNKNNKETEKAEKVYNELKKKILTYC